MPISIVVGGQFGSEGKGKVALEKVRNCREFGQVVVRVGGTNSGHSAYDRNGKRWALRQMPASCVDKNVDVVFPAGSYIDRHWFEKEISELVYPPERVLVSPYARVITEEHKEWERNGGLEAMIGSTTSGTGAAVLASVARESSNLPLVSLDAESFEPLSPYIGDTTEYLTNRLAQGARVVIEGTQGFGLSLPDGGYWPKATSRPTTAAGALADAGLSPLDVDDVTLVIRAFPIRVAGDSGPLAHEVTWEEVARITNRKANDIREYTTATNRLRRIGHFDAGLVIRAIRANNPTEIVLNHLDYVDDLHNFVDHTSRGRHFVGEVERKIGHRIDWVGFSGKSMVKMKQVETHDL